MTIEIEFDDGTTIHPPNKATAEKCLAHSHHTLGDVDWREVESPPDRDNPRFMSPAATVNDGVVLIQDGRELIFESIAILEHYVSGLAEGFPGDTDSLREYLSSPDVDVDRLLAR